MIVEGETLIFDLDGTLVDSSAFEGECYVSALRDVLGLVTIEEDWSRYQHVTDSGILRELIEELDVSDRDAAVEQVRDAFGRRIEGYFDAGGSCPAIPGARESMARLAESGFRVGIATGGWGHTAEMKLKRSGIQPTGLVISSCDDAMDRVGIMTGCLAKLGGNGDRVVYFGDGPWDMKATASLGWRFIGVGRRLAGKCDHWINDFQDPDWPFSPL